MNKHRIVNARFPQEDYELLQHMALKMDVSVSLLLRESIRLYAEDTGYTYNDVIQEREGKG